MEVGYYQPCGRLLFTRVYSGRSRFKEAYTCPGAQCKAYTAGDANLTIKVAKDSLAYQGMFIGSGKKGAEVASIDKSNKAYDVLTIKAAFGENIAKDAVLFEATAVGGTVKKNTANFVLYDAKKVESDGAVLCTLLMQAYEVKESKLVLPIHELDKVGLTSRFQFEY